MRRQMAAQKLHAPGKKPWRCPKCGREFSHRSNYHSCGNYTVEGYLQGKNPAAIALFKQAIHIAEKIAPITLSAGKTQISVRAESLSTFMMVFVAGRQIGGYIFLPREIPAPFVRKISAASSRRHVHHFRINDPAMFTAQFTDMLAEAIAMVSGAPAAPAEKTAPREMSIGEEINSIYRAERARS
jgi:hypothetical protein